jgi:hypothetical protein
MNKIQKKLNKSSCFPAGPTSGGFVEELTASHDSRTPWSSPLLPTTVEPTRAATPPPQVEGSPPPGFVRSNSLPLK